MKGITEIRWHGRAGQGTVSAAKFLADTALAAGDYIQAFPEYGPEREGAPVRAYNRLAKRPFSIYCEIEHRRDRRHGPTLLDTVRHRRRTPETSSVNTPCPADQGGAPAARRSVSTVDATNIRSALGKSPEHADARRAGEGPASSARDASRERQGHPRQEARRGHRKNLASCAAGSRRCRASHERKKAEATDRRVIPAGDRCHVTAAGALSAGADKKKCRTADLLACPDSSVIFATAHQVSTEARKGCGICAGRRPEEDSGDQMVEESDSSEGLPCRQPPDRRQRSHGRGDAPDRPTSSRLLDHARRIVENCVRVDGKVPTNFIARERALGDSACTARAAGGRVMTATSRPAWLHVEMLYVARAAPADRDGGEPRASAPLNIHGDHLTRWERATPATSSTARTRRRPTQRADGGRDLRRLGGAAAGDGATVTTATDRAVELLADEAKKFVGAYKPLHLMLDVKNPVTYGAVDLQDYYTEHKRQQAAGCRGPARSGARPRLREADGTSYGS
jgi:2-oxoacid:acceptor oxidoreductase gamma subunit (pyruvate/2-ketoisovalerate family)